MKLVLINNLTLNNMINYTDKIIDKTTDDILSSKFSINPKVYNGENISCRFCEYKDLCFMSNSNLKYLDKAEDLSFLGGEE